MQKGYEELEMSEDELKKLARSMKEEKESHIKRTRQKENKSFSKLKEMPIIKVKGVSPVGKGTLKFGKRINYKELLFKELDKDEPDMELVKEYKLKIERGEIEEYKPIKSPYLRMTRADGSVEWFEGVKAGTLEITRSDEKIAYIDLRKDKLQHDVIRNYDDTTVHGWDCYENDQNPLPQNIYMDSHAYFSNLEEIMANKKDVQTERLKQWGNITWTIGFVLVGLLVVSFVLVPMFTGKDVLTMINEAGRDPNANNNNNMGYNLTPEEITIINEIRQQRANAIADRNSAG